MKRVKMNLIILLVVIGLINSLCTSVSAAESGSITIQALDPANNAKPIPGIEATLYYVAQLSENYTTHFVKNATFSGFTEALSWKTSSECAEVANKLSAYVKSANVQGITQTTSSEGTATFRDLPKGLYLIVQTGSSNANYKEFAPYLIELPMYSNNQYVYDIKTYPKLEGIPVVSPTPTPTIPIDEPDIPEAPTNPPTPSPTPIVVPEPETPAGPVIPQTGMLMWPIPVLAVLGGGLMVLGGASVISSRKKGENKTDEK